jgi:hypothetical protein
MINVIISFNTNILNISAIISTNINIVNNI